MALIISARKKRLRSGHRPHERPVTLERNQICTKHSRKAARFTSPNIKFQNDAVRFSGRCALRVGISPLNFDGKLSSTAPSSGNFTWTTVAERVRNLESRGGATRIGG